MRQLMLDYGGDDSDWWATLADGIVALFDNLDGYWLVWSNQQGQWWRANRAGYTSRIEEAGRYSRAEAVAIVDQATVGGRLMHFRQDPYTGKPYRTYDEVAVRAPSDLDHKKEVGRGKEG